MEKYKNWRYCLESQHWKICKTTSALFGSSTHVCSKYNENRAECLESKNNKCSPFTSSIESFQLCPNDCDYTNFEIMNNNAIPYEYTGTNRDYLWYYHINAYPDVDAFKI